MKPLGPALFTNNSVGERCYRVGGCARDNFQRRLGVRIRD